MSVATDINKLYDLREEYRALNKVAEAKKAEFNTLEEQIISQMREEAENGLESIRTHKVSATLTTEVVPSIDDWDTFLSWVRENDMMYMLYRQVKATAFREFLSLYGTSPPGTTSKTIYKLYLLTR